MANLMTCCDLSKIADSADSIDVESTADNSDKACCRDNQMEEDEESYLQPPTHAMREILSGGEHAKQWVLMVLALVGDNHPAVNACLDLLHSMASHSAAFTSVLSEGYLHHYHTA